MKQLEDIESKVKYYANLPYHIIIETWDDGSGPYYVARVLELQGCMIHGDTPEEALHDIKEVKCNWIKTNLELGNKMPEPLKSREYSGKVNLRLPSSLHKSLVEIAELEGISFNQYMVSVLSKAAGHNQANKLIRKPIVLRQ
jgi:predicted RNase H-like HicB family nuclease